MKKFTPIVVSPPHTNHDWYAIDTEEILKELNTFEEEGLSSEEAQRRLKKYGPNLLKEAPSTSFWQMLWEQFNNFVVILLIVAAVISALLGDYIEAGAIMTIVILNAALGIIQEQKAEQALEALRDLAAPEAHVIRDGHRQAIPSSELVPGDLVLLETGNFVPADLRLLEAINLQIDEAPLTGESIPVKKDAAAILEENLPIGDRKNTAFMGTVVSYGHGKGVVVATGMFTQIGMIAEMIQSVEQEPTPLQRRLDQLGKTLGWAALAVCALVFFVGWLRGTPPLDMFLVAVSLAIAAVPEGLPAVVTISLAIGMREMIKRHALIRRLSSVETLGSATVICSDKTGTLTQNEMTATHLWVDGTTISITGGGYTPKGEFQVDGKTIDMNDYQGGLTALWVAALNNNASLEVTGRSNGKRTYRMVGEPTEGALIVAATKVGARSEDLQEAYPRIDEIPFDSERKRMVTIHSLRAPQADDISPFDDQETKPQGYVITVKGAPDIVLGLCNSYQRMDDTVAPLDKEQRKHIEDANDAMTKNALRVLAMAYKVTPTLPEDLHGEEIEGDLTFVGLIGIKDPPRAEVPQALQVGHKAGIRTVMITGDFPNTARAIADSIGLLRRGKKILTGPKLDKLDDETLAREVIDTDVFARVTPEHKLRIVKALRSHGEVVAMTGDGINDAPSIKQADIGIAMGITGTDVAKESADMVLTDDNYVSIISAVEQGRVIYSNIRKFVYYLLSCNLAEIATIFLATLVTGVSPLTPLQLLWLNLITDGAPALALATEEGDPDIMDRPPRPPDEPIINTRMRVGLIVQTIAITSITLGAYFLGLSLYPGKPEIAMTMAFVTLSFSELLRAFTARSEHYPIIKVGIFKNRYMNLAVLSSIILLLIVIYVPFLQTIFKTVPLTWEQWRYLLPLLFIPAVAAELTKMVMGWLRKKHRQGRTQKLTTSP